MSHLFALKLQLEISLLLRTDIKSHTNGLEEIAMFVRQTPSAHDNPARSPIREDDAMLALERSIRGARPIIGFHDHHSLVRMNP